MIVDHVEASLRYPMDFTYHIQNFSAVVYEKVSLQVPLNELDNKSIFLMLKPFYYLIYT